MSLPTTQPPKWRHGTESTVLDIDIDMRLSDVLGQSPHSHRKADPEFGRIPKESRCSHTITWVTAPSSSAF
jgi:hypothetical protein